MPDEISIQHGRRGKRDLKEETPPRSTLARHPDAGCMQVGSQHVQAGTCTQLQVSRSQPPPGMPPTPKPVTRIRWLPTTTTRDSTHCGGESSRRKRAAADPRMARGAVFDRSLCLSVWLFEKWGIKRWSGLVMRFRWLFCYFQNGRTTLRRVSPLHDTSLKTSALLPNFNAGGNFLNSFRDVTLKPYRANSDVSSGDGIRHLLLVR